MSFYQSEFISFDDFRQLTSESFEDMMESFEKEFNSSIDQNFLPINYRNFLPSSKSLPANLNNIAKANSAIEDDKAVFDMKEIEISEKCNKHTVQ
jgi:hypothetical protein